MVKLACAAELSDGHQVMRKGYTVYAALVVSALAATPLVMSAGGALATADGTGTVTSTLAVQPVEVSAVVAPQASANCARKIRIVYEGYAAAPSRTCTATR